MNGTRKFHKSLVWRLYLLAGMLFAFGRPLCAQETDPDTIVLQRVQKQEHFYDSLQYRASQRRFTGWLYDALVSPPRPYVDKKSLALDYFNPYEGKIISDIQIKALDVFGPSFTDTTKTPDNWMERTANAVHTNSNLRTIEKQLLFKVGDVLDPELMYENERIIRQLSYIKDVKIEVEQDSTFTGFVRVRVLTKDRFSFGARGGVNSTSSGNIEVFNKNIFGVGHEVSLTFVGHLQKEPYLGLETFYSIKNLGGKFLDVDLGYMNTYLREGFLFNLNKPFLTNDVKWGYGLLYTRLLRTYRITIDAPTELDDPLNEALTSVWGARSFDFGADRTHLTKLTFSAGIHNLTFFRRPDYEPDLQPFFANRTLYMAGISLTQRRYIQDQLIYSYGITEDIPEGFKNEILYGYDANEFGDRHYFQFFTSNGNLLLSQKGYIFMSAGIGGYLNKDHFEEGMVRGDIQFISKLVKAGGKRVRSFISLNYTRGINRYEIENLTLRHKDIIRGFTSKQALGKQRVALKLEHVVFLPHQFYKFNMAIFGFVDLGMIGSNQSLVTDQDFYSGLGVGLRLHNENLVFETFRLRLAVYPFHPKDMGLVGFILNEQSKQRFRSFDPTKPSPMAFE